MNEWKRQALEHPSSVFEQGVSASKDSDAQVDQCHRTLGQRMVERNFLARQLNRPVYQSIREMPDD